MKKTQKTMLTAAILTAAIGFAGCDNHDDMQNVYGPPPDMGSSAPATTYDPADEEPQPEYGADIAYERTEE